jgi:N-acetylglucosaminyldiphosphoundecaprenol N-acetyl-beta-D-mannosaminyltransferase
MIDVPKGVLVGGASLRTDEAGPITIVTTPERLAAKSDECSTTLSFGDRKNDCKATIAGVRIDSLDFDAVLEAIVQHVAGGGAPGYIVTPNAHHVVLFQSDPLLRDSYERALLVVPDGLPLQWAARLLGTPLRGRVNGTDLMEALCARAAECGLRVYLLGGREGAATAAVACLRARHPTLNVCGTHCPPFGFESDPVENSKILASIRAARPHILFVGLGAPKQEYWMSRNAQQLAVPVALGIGGSFEFVGGIVARAPRWMQRSGLEWLHRLGTEPRRLWKRYVFGNALFCFLVVRQIAAVNFAPQYSRTRDTSTHARAEDGFIEASTIDANTVA